MEKDIQVNIQNCSLSIYNSIISDLGPFFESPIPPATDGPSIKLRIVLILWSNWSEPGPYQESKNRVVRLFDIHLILFRGGPGFLKFFDPESIGCLPSIPNPYSTSSRSGISEPNINAIKPG